MEVGCYDMHLYCDVYGAEEEALADARKLSPYHPYKMFPFVYTGNTRGQCVKQARQHGWIFCRDGKVICPLHSKKLKPANLIKLMKSALSPNEFNEWRKNYEITVT